VLGGGAGEGARRAVLRGGAVQHVRSVSEEWRRHSDRTAAGARGDARIRPADGAGWGEGVQPGVRRDAGGAGGGDRDRAGVDRAGERGDGAGDGGWEVVTPRRLAYPPARR